MTTTRPMYDTPTGRLPTKAHALDAIDKAMQIVDDLCQGRTRWVMNVPALPDSDPDLVISEALRLAKAYIDRKPDAE
jgi:hypothetical protein